MLYRGPSLEFAALLGFCCYISVHVDQVMLTGNICLRDALSHIDAWLQSSLSDNEQRGVVELCFHRYPLSNLDSEYDMYFSEGDAEPLYTPEVFKQMIESDADLRHAVVGGPVGRDQAIRLILAEYTKRLNDASKEYSRLQQRVKDLKKIANGESAAEILKAGTEMGEIETTRKTNDQYMQDVQKDIQIARKLKPTENDAVKKALAILEISAPDLKGKIPYHAIGSSNELLWILLLYKTICPFEKYSRGINAITQARFVPINEMMNRNGLPQYNNIDAFLTDYPRIHSTIDDVMKLLKVRADYIAEVDVNRRHTMDHLDADKDRIITELTNRVNQLETPDQHVEKKPRQ